MQPWLPCWLRRAGLTRTEQGSKAGKAGGIDKDKSGAGKKKK